MRHLLFLLFCLTLNAKITALYLSLSGDPATSMAIQWHTTQDGCENVLMFETSNRNWEKKVGECITTEPAPIYKVALDNLTPDTEYSFRLGNHPRVYQFRTAADDLDVMSFAIYSKSVIFSEKQAVIACIINRGVDLFAKDGFFSVPLYPSTILSMGSSELLRSPEEPIRESCEKTRAAFQRIYSPDLPPDPLAEQAQTAGSGNKEQQVLRSDRGADYGSEQVQEAFDIFHKRTVSLVAQVMQSLPDPKDFSLYAALHGIGLLRLKMAVDTKTGDAVQLGMWRTNAALLPVEEDDPYPYSAVLLVTPMPKDSRYDRYYQRVQSILGPGYEAIKIRENLDGSEMELSHIQSDCIVHTPAIQTVKVLNHLETKIQKILEQELGQSRSALLRELAFVHWWLAQLTPFFRGSASCTEILIQAIAVTKGLSPPRLAGIPWDDKENGIIFGDLEAICMPLEQFINQYESMIERIRDYP